MKRLLSYLLAISAFFTIIPIALYLVHVAKASDWVFSSSADDWASFGDFFGGVLGPIYAFLAFLSFLVTVHLQSKQIEIMENRSSLDELQRLLAMISKTVDDRLAEIKEVTDPSSSSTPRKVELISLRLLLRGAGVLTIGNAAEETTARDKEIVQASIKAAAVDFREVSLEFHQMVRVLESHATKGGDPEIAYFYRERYEDVVCYLHAVGGMSPVSRAVKYFSSLERRKYLYDRATKNTKDIATKQIDDL